MQNFQRRMRNYLIAIVMLAAMACIMASMSAVVYRNGKANPNVGYPDSLNKIVMTQKGE